MTPDLLNFKKGWMSKQDENGEWKKHWFVLTDAGLRYYRDSGAEEKDDLDGEIDLKSCVKVSEFDVEKNYGFQIHTREAVVVLSAMTAGIRRNWIEVLRKSVRPSSSPDLTQLPDSSSDKENSRSLASTHRAPCHRGDARSETPTPAPTARRFDYVELSPVPVPSTHLPTNQRQAGEGQGREHGQWQEERSREATNSTWEQVLLRKGTEGGGVSEAGAGAPAAGGRRGVGGGGCGPEAPCVDSLQAMERAHKQALEELQKQHAREVREMERTREQLLRDETLATAQVMEALKKAHRDELEREVEKANRLGGGNADTQTLRTQHQLETQDLQRQLSDLSDVYSQKCLELNRAQQRSGDREKDLFCKEKEIEQLRKENQDIQTRLMDEINRMRSVTGQVSEGVRHDKQTRPSCELEVLLRVKENEVQYLHKEISCLRNELQFLNTEKQSACERYKEVQDELSGGPETRKQPGALRHFPWSSTQRPQNVKRQRSTGLRTRRHLLGEA
ncbi:hypothetical protein UPYG_G00101750 [Umbra pygmaea]|uniref:PH domain-containing protein n=1 Tax=Umbra pygmaea TaxID=75934 RepID=A0ABD0X0W2_UMBPY